MYDLPFNTVAQYLVNPTQTPVNLQGVRLQTLKQPLSQLYANTQNTEQSLLNFYFYNHAFHLIISRYNMYDRLPDELAAICERNQTVSSQIGTRMFFQVLMATHCHLFGVTSAQPNYQDFFVSAYGQEMWDFFLSSPNSYNFKKWLAAFPSVSLDEFFASTLMTFTCSGSSAAKAWADIARLSLDYVRGDISLESMTDQAFSICHNGGSILNKGHLFSVCTNQMYSLLDVQDSGQIPQWILSHLNQSCVDAQLKKDSAVVARHFPEIQTQIDQNLVKASEQKRSAYTQAIAKHFHHANNWKAALNAPQKVNHAAKLNKVLLGAQALK